MRGEIELEGDVLVIKRIKVKYSVTAPADARNTIARVHDMHARHCPVYRSIHKAIKITTDYELNEI